MSMILSDTGVPLSIDPDQLPPDAASAGTQAAFSGYLDGAVTGHEMQRIAAHLEACSPCAAEFTAWRAMQNTLALLRPAKAPHDLGLKLRLAISRESARRASGLFETFGVRWQNSIRPLMLQVSAGFATTVVLLGTIGFLLGTVAAPQAVLANDEPLGAITSPHYLYSADRPRPIRMTHDATLVVEAKLNDQGRVFDYTIVSGPQDPAVLRQVENQLLLSVFEPASVFGAPVRSRVILTYSGVSVRA